MGLKTKLAMAMATSAAGAAMIAGGSFAMFTAQASNTGNTFTAGNLNLNLSKWQTAQSTSLSFTQMAPGDQGQDSFTVSNTGNLDEYVGLSTVEQANGSAPNIFVNQTASDNAGSTDNNPLTLTVSVYSGTTTSGSALAQYTVPVGGDTGNTPAISWKLPANQTDTVVVSYNFPKAAGNDYQGASGVATFNLQAVQVKNNNTNSNNSTTPDSWS
ncbi:hypothetical protein Heshes_07990 [Alicyclobacillus hesperidum]|uniref:SipW-cognate class signal peptide n=1 Tax=Alicyclobacillus hesperidum TaxID=89784 RepID=A0AA37X2U3_9BACL|nr:TasA family protein [Alicyclobacillus hesperidum]GLV13115.1 hypothetical protein Heshes_07990 [Alicyclobacillus hesperidum]